jgi:hypothetical protein
MTTDNEDQTRGNSRTTPPLLAKNDQNQALAPAENRERKILIDA